MEQHIWGQFNKETIRVFYQSDPCVFYTATVRSINHNVGSLRAEMPDVNTTIDAQSINTETIVYWSKRFQIHHIQGTQIRKAFTLQENSDS